MLSLIVRRPHDVRLRSITAMVACWTVAFLFGISAARGATFLGLAPMAAQLINHVLMAGGAYCLLCFFLFSAFDSREADRLARRQAVVLATVLCVLVVATAAIPAAVRDAAAALTTSRQYPGLRGVFGIGLFYTTANGYLVYAFLRGAVSARRTAHRAQRGLRLALLIVTWGLLVLALAFGIFALGSALRWAGGVLPSPIRRTGIVLSLPGFTLLLSGLGCPAAITRWAAIRVWWHHLRTYHALGPLWRALHAEFPEDALTRTPVNPWLDRMHLTAVHRRFYRRVVECRDGLVRVSPYVAHIQAADAATPAAATPDVLAGQLSRALHAHAAGVVVDDRAVPIASPAADGLAADVVELVALARALSAQSAVGPELGKSAHRHDRRGDHATADDRGGG